MALPRWIWAIGLFVAFSLGLLVSAPPVSPASEPRGFVAAPSPTIGTRPTGYGSVPGGDKDCGDFSSHAQAQAFFEAQGAGDPHRLDGDGDGIACEQLR